MGRRECALCKPPCVAAAVLAQAAEHQADVKPAAAGAQPDAGRARVGRAGDGADGSAGQRCCQRCVGGGAAPRLRSGRLLGVPARTTHQQMSTSRSGWFCMAASDTLAVRPGRQLGAFLRPKAIAHVCSLMLARLMACQCACGLLSVANIVVRRARICLALGCALKEQPVRLP